MLAVLDHPGLLYLQLMQVVSISKLTFVHLLGLFTLTKQQNQHYSTVNFSETKCTNLDNALCERKTPDTVRVWNKHRCISFATL